MMCISYAILHINAHGRGCCSLHIGAVKLLNAVQQLLMASCQPTFTPHADWQCTQCRAMNMEHEDDEQAACDICGYEKDVHCQQEEGENVLSAEEFEDGASASASGIEDSQISEGALEACDVSA